MNILEQTPEGFGLYLNANKIEFMSFKRKEAIFILSAGF